MKRFLNSLKNILINGGLFVLIGVITYRAVFSQADFRSVLHTALHSRTEYLLCGLAAVVLMLAVETWTLRRNLGLLGEVQSFRQCLLYTFAGNFFSAITPAATGGQPMQLYLMHKKGVSVVHGTLALAMELACYQFAVTLLGVVGYLSFGPLIHRLLGPYLWLLWLGLGLNTALLVLLLCAMFTKRLIHRLTAGVVWMVSVCSKERAASVRAGAEAAIAQYQTSAALFRRHKRICLVNCLATLLRILAMHSAPFWVYKALGLNDVSLFQIVALQSALYISCAALPFPGGIGIAENHFLHYFKRVFPPALLQSSMVLSRGLGSYFTMVLSGGVLMGAVLIAAVRRRWGRTGGSSFASMQV